MQRREVYIFHGGYVSEMVVTVGGRVELWQAVALDSTQRSGAGVVASRLDT